MHPESTLLSFMGWVIPSKHKKKKKIPEPFLDKSRSGNTRTALQNDSSLPKHIPFMNL